MKVSIFVRSYRGDRFFLDYLLRSLEKFSKGFHEIVVGVPAIDEPHFRHTDFHGAKLNLIDEPEEGKGYLYQQITKLYSDMLCEGDFIMVVDSDCFFFESFTSEEYFIAGKPISLLRHWADAGSGDVWKPITEKFTTFEMMFEGMACLPFIIDRRVLPMIRDYCESTHKESISSYILRQPNGEFSEFNALSAFSHRFTPYLYHWQIADPATDGFPRKHWQRWSWDKAGVDPFREEYEKILAS